MNGNRLLAVVGFAIAGASIYAGQTIPPDVPWWIHTIVAAIQGGSYFALLIVDPSDLAQVVTRPPAPPHG